MTAGQRENDERGDIQEELVQKLESYLRAHFDEKSSKSVSREAKEGLLMEVAADWLLNRGLPLDMETVRDACGEAISRYDRNWKGKRQGEDVRGGKLGRFEAPRVNEYLS